MTTFFNKKEEVIDIELTPYGKHLFSAGQFRPSFYSFYDNDILYDGAYGGIIEPQNNIVTRIKDGTPYLKPLVNFTSSVAQVRTMGLYQDPFQTPVSSSVNFLRPLGKNSPWRDFKPAWSISLINDSVLLSGSYQYQAGYTIPTLSASILNIDYSTFPLENADPPVTIFALQDSDRFIIDVQELNTTFKLNGNYDIEIFRMPDPDDEDIIEPLKFINADSYAAADLNDQSESPYSYLTLLSGDEIQQRSNFPLLDETYVEYYLSVRVDNEIIDAPPILKPALYNTQQNTPSIICSDVQSIGGDY